MSSLVRLGTSFQDRVFVKSKALRDRITGIFIVRPGGVVSGARAPSTEERDKICAELYRENLPTYSDLFDLVFEDDLQEGTIIFHPYLEIMRTLALNAPVCHVVKPHIMPAIQHVIEGQPVIGVLPSISMHSPMLARLLHGCNGRAADEVTKDIFQEMLNVAKKAFPEDAQVRSDQRNFFLIFHCRMLPHVAGASHPFARDISRSRSHGLYGSPFTRDN